VSTALTTIANTPLSITETRRSSQQMLAQRAAIVETMSQVMRKEIDYGTIPGTPKPTLYKPGSEKILSMFNLAATPTVEDLSTPDTIRYRVHVAIVHIPSGNALGTGVGEASSAESKYQWRAAVCDEEWNETPEDRRRTKWKKGGNGAYSVRQIRADMEDIANTVLKMAKKRAQIDAVLTVTAASDVFAQDVEELVAAGLDLPPDATDFPPAQAPLPADLQRKADAPLARAASTANPSPSHSSTPSGTQAPRSPQPRQQPAQSTATRAPQNGYQTISGPQASRFWAIAMQTWKDHTKVMDYLRNVIGVQKKDDIPVDQYEEAIAWAEGKQGDA
jgi:hypothetical protein